MPPVFRWVLLASLFITTGVLVIRSKATRATTTFWMVLLGLLCALLVGFIDFWQSFGEAFTSGVNHYRAPIHF